MEASDLVSLAELLRGRCRGQVFDELAEREACASDFGGMVRLIPTLVLRPASVQDVQEALRFAAESKLTVGIRGAGHSQSGQGLGAGLLLDMISLNHVLDLDPSGCRIEVEAGIVWRKVVDATFALQLLPVALTYALDTTVGGTLSVGGVGAMAWNHGPQVDNILYLDVVTSNGDLVRCSLEHERELFDSVRGGLGQCGVIVRAGIRLRRCGSSIETRTFVYREVDDLLRDAYTICTDPVPNRLLAVRLAPDPLFARRLMAVLFVGHDVDDAGSVPALPPLHHGHEPPTRRTPTWTSDGHPRHPFFRIFGGHEETAPWPERRHPWVDFLYPLSAAAGALNALAANPDRVLTFGPSEIIFVRRTSNPAPLLVTPQDDLAMGLGAYPAFATQSADWVASTMQRYARTMAACGGKRYLCGYFGPTETSDWAAHYGGAWPQFCEAKMRHDPNLRFESNLVRWPFARP